MDALDPIPHRVDITKSGDGADELYSIENGVATPHNDTLSIDSWDNALISRLGVVHLSSHDPVSGVGSGDVIDMSSLPGSFRVESTGPGSFEIWDGFDASTTLAVKGANILHTATGAQVTLNLSHAR